MPVGLACAKGFTGRPTAEKCSKGGLAYKESFNHYFVMAIYRAGAQGSDHIPIQALECSDMTKNQSPWLWCDFSSTSDSSKYYTDSKKSDEEDLVMKIGTSFISYEQALLNMQQEVGTKTFDEIMAQNKQEWETQLSKMQVKSISHHYSHKDQQDMLAMFYSASYRSALFPRDLSEVNDEGRQIHYSPYITADKVQQRDDLVYTGPLTADQGWWDAYTTVYPLYSLVNTDRLGSILTGWLNTFKESGWLQQWPSPGQRGCMVGTASDISLGDAIVKDIPGFDQELAYASMRKNAFEQPTESDGNVGRVCLNLYIEKGYIPYDNEEGCRQVVSRTLSYWQSDYAIAQAAHKLGYDDDYRTLYDRAMNYSVLFDQNTQFFRMKDASGKYADVFDELGWGDPYTEAGPYQYRFAIPYDSQGLARHFSSSSSSSSSSEEEEVDISSMCRLLEDIQTMPGTFHVSGYGEVIHEQTEMNMNCWGQYAHNNQPSHYMLWMFGAISDMSKNGKNSKDAMRCKHIGDKYLRRVLSDLYKNDVQMFVGDEDNGQMSAWYLLASMGLYTLSPGDKVMNLGSPLFEEMIIYVGQQQQNMLRIVAKNNGPEHVYVQRVAFNGVDLGEGVNSIEYQQLMKGGKLEFFMTDRI